MILKPSIGPGPSFLKEYKKAMSELAIVGRRDVSRVLSLRCSQLPFCAPSAFIGVAKNPYFQSLDMRGLYYTSVGTAVHTIMQTAIPQSTEKVIGNWKCRDCGKFLKMRSQPECCDLPMEYVEIDIDYKGIKGHIDCVFVVNGKHYIVDFKTTSVAAKDKKRKNPGAAYIEQIQSYAYLIGKQYGIKIHGVMLVFIPRDNPDEPVVYEEPIDSEKLKNIGRRLKQQRAAHKDVINAETLEDVIALADYGRCKNEFCQVCISGNVKRQLREAYNLAKKGKILPFAERLKKKKRK